jgi:acyl dehydratase
MRVLNGRSEVLDSAGLHLGVSEWLTVNQGRVNTFADATGDHQWIHVDAQRAKAGPFGGTIAHGYLTLSMVAEFFPQIFEVRGFSMTVNYGLNKVRFPSPVHVGSRIRGSVSVADIDTSGPAITLTLATVVEIEGSGKPACVAEVVFRYIE